MSIEFLFILAFILLLLELVIPSLGTLGVAGFIAFVAGMVGMLNQGITEFYGLSVEMVAAIGLSVFAIFGIGSYFIYKSFRKKVQTGIESMIGKTATVTSWDGLKGKIAYEGEDWRATSLATLSAGDTVRITQYNNLTLTVEKDS